MIAMITASQARLSVRTVCVHRDHVVAGVRAVHRHLAHDHEAQAVQPLIFLRRNDCTDNLAN